MSSNHRNSSSPPSMPDLLGCGKDPHTLETGGEGKHVMQNENLPPPPSATSSPKHEVCNETETWTAPTKEGSESESVRENDTNWRPLDTNETKQIHVGESTTTGERRTTVNGTDEGIPAVNMQDEEEEAEDKKINESVKNGKYEDDEKKIEVNGVWEKEYEEKGKEDDDEVLVVGINDAFLRLLKQAGAYGKWQWRLFFITSFCGLFCALHNLSAAFLAATPDHWCKVPELQNVNTTLDLRNISIPWMENGENNGASEYSSCTYYDRNWTGLVSSGALSGDTLPNLPTENVSTTTCHDWTYDHSIYETTAVEEWDLVCENKYRMSLIQSTFMAGVLAGAIILSELSDKYGRRTIALISSVGFLISGLSTTFVTHYAAFLFFRFLVATFGSGLFLPLFVILMESVGPEGRTTMGMLYQGFFAVGFMLLPGIAYFVNEWRYLQLSISVPSVLLLLYYWFLPESPRWLMTQGRHNEALMILKEVARVNGRSLPPQEELDALIGIMNKESSKLKSVVGGEVGYQRKPKDGVDMLKDPDNMETRECNAPPKSTCLQKFVKVFSSIITLLSTPNLRRRCLIIFFSWFVVSMVYYGLTFSGGNINASPYLLVFLSGLVEIPSYFLVCWTLKKFGRRLNLCVLFIICGTACLLILAVPKEMVGVNMGLATVGKFFNSAAFGVAYIYSAELVPTPVRNISVGTSSMCARIGSALAPFIVDLMGDLHYAVPSTVFGLLSVSAGLLALLLPETSKTRLPETVEEVEALPR